ncbi:hypothetical protein BST61_g7882 [Cercospora zeina]
MRTRALWATLLLLISITLILWTTLRGTPEFAQPYFDTAAEYIQSQQTHKDDFTLTAPRPAPPRPQATQSWTYAYREHGRNFGLTEEQCGAAFPDLFKEIDRAVEYRKTVAGNITQDETSVDWKEDGIVKAQIYENQLYILDPRGITDGNTRPRALATLNSLHRAVSASPTMLPNIEFSFVVHDFALDFWHPGNQTTWAYTRKTDQPSLWLMPDFGLWGWPDVGLRSYQELQSVLERTESLFEDKVPKLVWRGSLDVGSKEVRQGLVDHSKDQPWADVKALHWDDPADIEQNLLTMQDHCAYQFVAQTEGNSYSGRLKFLLNCHSVLLSHDLEWVELYHHLMIGHGLEQNYVHVQRDYSDLRTKMRRLLHPSSFSNSAQTIADNARRTFRERYLTPAAEACYWRALIRAWASVQGFEPQFWQEVEHFDKVTQKKQKLQRPVGAPFEAYAIMEEVNWEVPAIPRKMCIKKPEEEQCREH